jgi:hypothetical protein
MLKLILAAIALLPFIVSAQSFDHTHAPLDALLKANVANGMVNYKALKATPAPLAEYLKQSGAVTEANYKGFTRPQQLAFLINLYNAATLKLIVDHYPVKSIKDCGTLFKGPWKQVVVPLWGQTVSLDHLEHEVIRPTFKEPRAHFALVCAAKGCPPLRAEAYTPEKLEAQLDDQGRVFLGTAAKNHVDTAKMKLFVSPIFDWYGGDFVEKAGSVEKFVLPFWPEKDKAATSKGGFGIEFTDYDWTLNEQP